VLWGADQANAYVVGAGHVGSFNPAVAVEKLLFGSEWGFVQFFRTVD
jgi:hypothetical protein